MTQRESLARALDLPNDADWDDIEEQVIVARKIEEAESSLKEEGGISLQELEMRFDAVIARHRHQARGA